MAAPLTGSSAPQDDDGEKIVYHEPRPRILLVNFSAATVEKLKAKDHNVKRAEAKMSQYNSPVPSHAVDILMVRTGLPLEGSPAPTMSWPVGRSHDIGVFYTEQIVKHRGTCVFFVGEPVNLPLNNVQITADPTHQLLPGSAHKLLRPRPYEPLTEFIQRHMRDGKSYVGLRQARTPATLVPLIEDEAGTPFAVVEPRPLYVDPGAAGLIICLPDYGDDSEIVHELLQEVLRNIVPQLYDVRADLSWLHDPDLIHPRRADLERQKAAVRAESERRLSDLDDDIQTVEQQDEFMRSLLTNQSEQLKNAVKTALEELLRAAGITGVSVLDVDSDPALRDGSQERREDLRIEWDGEIYLLDCAGREGAFKYDSLNQLAKHQRLFLRVRTVHIDTLHVMLIGNHYAGPAEPKKRGHMFGTAWAQAGDSLTDAGHGAMATSDLFRIIRLVQRREVIWTGEALKRLLRTVGFFDFDTFVTVLKGGKAA